MVEKSFNQIQLFFLSNLISLPFRALKIPHDVSSVYSLQSTEVSVLFRHTLSFTLNSYSILLYLLSIQQRLLTVRKAVLQRDSHLFEVIHSVFWPVDVAHHPSRELIHGWVVVLREGQEQSQHPDHSYHHFGLCRWHALLQRVDDGHVPAERKRYINAEQHLSFDPRPCHILVTTTSEVE